MLEINITIEVLLEVYDTGRPRFLISPRHSICKLEKSPLNFVVIF
jgi:hypothetical protein